MLKHLYMSLLNMRDPLFLCAAVFSALLLLPYLSLAQEAVAGFDVFVTPTNNEVVTAGSNFDIIWTPSSPAGPVTIILMQGATEQDQEFGPTIACKLCLCHLLMRSIASKEMEIDRYRANSFAQRELTAQLGNIPGLFPPLTATTHPMDSSYSSTPIRPYSNIHTLL
jgi:hypothetical protein